MAAVVQIEAAVVSPRTDRPSRKMTPAPRKPMPVMMPCAIRVGSVRMVYQQAGGEADQRVGSEAGGAPVKTALEPDDAACDQRRDKMNDDGQRVGRHDARSREED